MKFAFREETVKKLINAVDTVLSESLDGFAEAHSQNLEKEDNAESHTKDSLSLEASPLRTGMTTKEDDSIFLHPPPIIRKNFQKNTFFQQGIFASKNY